MNKHPARTTGRAALLGVLALVLAVPLPAVAAPQTSYPGEAGSIVTRAGDGLVPTVRWYGQNRFDTARLIATDDTSFAAPFESGTVLIARGDDYPDALAGGYLAGQTASPILLTASETVTAEAAEALDELEPEDVVLLGGPAAISADVEAALGEDFEVTRVAGGNRYDTAAVIARSGADQADVAIVASGENFPDALAAGQLAVSEGFPLLLTAAGALPEPTSSALTDLDVETVLLAGGPAAVSPAVEAQIVALGIEVRRVFGATRSGTGTAFARLAIDEYGYSPDHLQLATGQQFPDALAVVPHAGLEEAPVLLTSAGGDVDAELQAYLEEVGTCDFGALHLSGGPVALTPAAEDAARAALTTGPCNVTADLVPGDVLTGEDASVRFSVTNNAGGPSFLEDVTVTAEPAEGSAATPSPESSTVQSGPTGAATATLTSQSPGDVEVAACITGPDDTEVCSEAVTVTFVNLPALATGFDGLRGVTLGPDGDLFAAEQGTGGPGDVAVGDTGAIARVDPDDGTVETFTAGLPSFRVEFGGVTGPTDVDFADDGTAAVSIGLGAPASERDVVAEDFAIAANLGTLANVAADGTVNDFVDLAAYELAENPDGAPATGDADSNPFAALALDDGTQLAIDAGGNSLVHVVGGAVVDEDTVVFPGLSIPTPGGPIAAQAVPTGIAEHPDGGYLVSELGGRLWHVPEDFGDPEVLATGFEWMLDVAVGPDGDAYVVEWLITQSVSEEAPAPSRVVRVDLDDPDAPAEVVVDAGLTTPLGLAVGEDSLFVANCGLCPSGALVEVELAAAASTAAAVAPAAAAPDARFGAAAERIAKELGVELRN